MLVHLARRQQQYSGSLRVLMWPLSLVEHKVSFSSGVHECIFALGVNYSVRDVGKLELLQWFVIIKYEAFWWPSWSFPCDHVIFFSYRNISFLSYYFFLQRDTFFFAEIVFRWRLLLEAHLRSSSYVKVSKFRDSRVGARLMKLLFRRSEASS